MKIHLWEHFNFKKLFRFTMPSIIMMVFTSIYGVVDGFFVSNFVGKTEFAAVNFIMPVIMILGGLGFMFGSGGSALISKTMGEGDSKKANKIFSMIIYVSFILGVVLAIVTIIFIEKIAMLLGAEGGMLAGCVTYGRILLVSLPFFILQFEFQTFFVTAEKPQLGLFTTIIAGVLNIVLDFLFIAVFEFGIIGAAVATTISQISGGLVPLIYFIRKNDSLLKIGKINFDINALLKVITNGSSELMSNISMSIVNMLYNYQLMKYAGENGVAAYGVLMYVNLIFLSIFIGYSVGTAPIIGYNYGSGNSNELKSLLKRSLVIIGISSLSMLILGEVLAYPLSALFVGYDKTLLDITIRAFAIYSFMFLFAGISIYGSSFFTALNNGLISAIISFLRTLVFQIGAVLILPLFFELDGIWASVVVAELMATVMTIIFLIAKKKKYNY